MCVTTGVALAFRGLYLDREALAPSLKAAAGNHALDDMIRIDTSPFGRP
jgi:hypothetical protein